MRETILSGCIDKVRSRKEEEQVDVDKLIIEYLSETDEDTDEEIEERKQNEVVLYEQNARDGEANALARKALEEFESLVDDEN